MSMWSKAFSIAFGSGNVVVPPPPVMVESLDGTVITQPSDSAIINAFGEAWSLKLIGGMMYVAVNGILDSTLTHSVNEIVYISKRIWVKNILNIWFNKRRQSDPWTYSAASPVNTSLTSVLTEITALSAMTRDTAMLAALAKLRVDVMNLKI